jgi:NAD(P)-dependent dehydrogenase (short-subunit alcohol dehydrogenase family)
MGNPDDPTDCDHADTTNRSCTTNPSDEYACGHCHRRQLRHRTATAIALAQRGYGVGVGYRSDAAGASATASAVRHAGRWAETFRLDLADPPAAAATVEHAALELGGLDVFVNNAGINRRAPFLEETLADWQRVLTVDLTGPFACAQAAVSVTIDGGLTLMSAIANQQYTERHSPEPQPT